MNSRSAVPAQTRGAAVGSLSGGVSIAAHGIGGGVPSDGSVVLLLVACVALGAVVGTIHMPHRRHSVAFATLAAGQSIGHTTLSSSSEHIHGLVPSPSMLAAHAGALAVTAAVVLATETACIRALAVLARVILIAVAQRPVTTELWTATPVHRSKLSLWLLAGSTAGTRGPPAFI